MICDEQFAVLECCDCGELFLLFEDLAHVGDSLTISGIVSDFRLQERRFLPVLVVRANPLNTTNCDGMDRGAICIRCGKLFLLYVMPGEELRGGLIEGEPCCFDCLEEAARGIEAEYLSER
jgi:hypothetical protein